MNHNVNYIQYKKEEHIILSPQSEIEKTWSTLDPGYYSFKDIGGLASYLYAFTAIKSREALIKFKDGTFKDIMQECSKLFKKETVEKYKEIEICRKMGIILYGPPGTGKTCTAELIMRELVESYRAICINCTGHELTESLRCITEIRKYQDNPIVLFVDECDHYLRNEENRYLTYLDGNTSLENSLFIGCTNYLDKISERIKDRKSRIRKCFEVKSLPFEVYKEYIFSKLKNKISEDDLQKFAYLAVEAALSIDQLKHAVIDWYIEGYQIEFAINNIKTIKLDETK